MVKSGGTGMPTNSRHCRYGTVGLRQQLSAHSRIIEGLVGNSRGVGVAVHLQLAVADSLPSV